jgi:hypothetical protein
VFDTQLHYYNALSSVVRPPPVLLTKADPLPEIDAEADATKLRVLVCLCVGAGGLSCRVLAKSLAYVFVCLCMCVCACACADCVFALTRVCIILIFACLAWVNTYW